METCATVQPSAQAYSSEAREFWLSVKHHVGYVQSIVWDSGSWCCMLAAFLFAFNALLVKLLEDRVPTSQVVLVRSIISLIFCIYTAYVSNIHPLFGHLRNMHLLLSRGAFGAAAMQTLYLSITLLPLADAVTLFFLNPAVTTVAAWLILREYLGLMGSAGVLISLGGLILLTQPPFIFGHAENWGHDRTLGTIFGIVSSLFAAGAFISIRLIGKREPPLVMSVWFHSTALVSSIIPLAIGYMGHAVWPIAVDWVILIGIGIISFVGQMVLSRGFQLLMAAKASAINFTQVVWSYLFGIMFLHEHISGLGVLGSLLIAAGAVMVNLRKPSKPEQKQHCELEKTEKATEVSIVLTGSSPASDQKAATADHQGFGDQQQTGLPGQATAVDKDTEMGKMDIKDEKVKDSGIWMHEHTDLSRQEMGAMSGPNLSTQAADEEIRPLLRSVADRHPP